MSNDPINRFTLLVLFQAQQDGATELVVSGKVAEVPVIKYKVDDVWYNMSSPPSDVLPKVVDEFESLAELADSAFPRDGKIDVQFSGAHLKWRIRVASPGADCVLTPIPNDSKGC